MNPYVNSLAGFGGGFIAFWPSQGISELPFSGGRRQPRLANVRKKTRFKAFTEVFESFEELEDLEVEPTSFGLSQEITRFESITENLESQLALVQSEIEVFKARESLEAQLRAEFLIEDAIRAGRFLDGLLIQIVELRAMRKRREEEELIILLLMDD